MDIRKNTREIIRVEPKKYKGRDLVDFRIWVEGDPTGELIPTRKGVTFRRELLPDVIKALEGSMDRQHHAESETQR